MYFVPEKIIKIFNYEIKINVHGKFILGTVIIKYKSPIVAGV